MNGRLTGRLLKRDLHRSDSYFCFYDSLTGLVNRPQESPMATAANRQSGIRDCDRSIGKEIPFLQTADAGKGLGQPLWRDVRIGNSLVDGLHSGNHPIPIPADQRHVATGLESQNGSIADSVVIDDCMHFKVICQDDSIILQLLSQQF